MSYSIERVELLEPEKVSQSHKLSEYDIINNELVIRPIFPRQKINATPNLTMDLHDVFPKGINDKVLSLHSSNFMFFNP